MIRSWQNQGLEEPLAGSQSLPRNVLPVPSKAEAARGWFLLTSSEATVILFRGPCAQDLVTPRGLPSYTDRWLVRTLNTQFLREHRYPGNSRSPETYSLPMGIRSLLLVLENTYSQGRLSDISAAPVPS